MLPTVVSSTGQPSLPPVRKNQKELHTAVGRSTLKRNGAVKSFLIADDHEIVRTGLRAIIEARSDWIVTAEAADGLQAVQLARIETPDIMIV
jgi:PleD family two-component response regulator